MISVCIPVYNHDISELVNELHKQLTAANVPFEILLQDDGSTDKSICKLNAALSLSYVIYEENGKNLGRSVTRNKLAEKAEMEHLLFIDNDMVIDNPNYIKNYLDQRSKAIVYGGVSYSNSDNKRLLRAKYGSAIESNVTNNKSKVAYFSACNFLISKLNFNKVLFDESLIEYGYEDTLFAKDALSKKLEIQIVNNPVQSKEIISNEQFLRNTSAALRNLHALYIAKRLKASDGIRILEAYEKVNNNKFNQFALTAYKILGKRTTEFRLLNGLAGVKDFQLWKLAEFSKHS